MLEDIACYDVLLDLAANTCEGDGPIIAGFVLSPFLKIAVTLAVFQFLGMVPVSKLFR